MKSNISVYNIVYDVCYRSKREKMLPQDIRINSNNVPSVRQTVKVLSLHMVILLHSHMEWNAICNCDCLSRLVRQEKQLLTVTLALSVLFSVAINVISYTYVSQVKMSTLKFSG